MHTHSEPFWRLPWWEGLILIGSPGVILRLYLLAVTGHARMLKRVQEGSEDRRHRSLPDTWPHRSPP